MSKSYKYNDPKHQKLDSQLLSATIKKLGAKPKGGSTTIAEILEHFHENGILLGMLFFAMPLAIPMPFVPGVTTIMGTPLIFLSIQLLLGYKKIWLPQRVNRYTLSNSFLKTIDSKLTPYIVWVEKFMKRRFDFSGTVLCEQIVGLICLIAAVSIAIPLPFTNMMPAQGITIAMFGMLGRDGLVIIIGSIVAIIGSVIAMGMVVASWVAIKTFLSFIF